MLNVLFLHVRSGKREVIKPELKSCCICRSYFSAMYFLTLTLIAVYYIISHKTGVGVALVHVIPPSSAGSFSLLFTTGTSLSFFTPKNFSKCIVASKLNRATRVDYFVSDKLTSTLVFWYDAAERTIFKAHLSDSGVRNISAIVWRGIADVREVMIDRASRNIYWLDYHYQRIEIAKLDGSYRTTLVSNIQDANGMRLDPEMGFLFWSDRNGGDDYVIERSYLNGDGKEKIVASNSLVVFTIDCRLKMIYWIDRSGTLHKTDYDGRNGIELGKSEALASVFSLAIWNGTLYWTDSVHQTVSKAEVGRPETVEVLTLAYPQLYDIKIFHPTDSSVLTRSKCLFDNGGCSHMCLSGRDLSPSCHCPYGLRIDRDNRTCKDVTKILGYATRDVERFHFVDFHDPSQWVFPPLSIHQASETSFAVDPLRKEIYWISQKNILKQSIADNSSLHTVLNLDYFQPKALALDWSSRTLFMLLSRRNNETGILSVASYTGEFFTHLLWKDMYAPGLLSVDSKNKILFWSHTRSMINGSIYHIESSSLDGRDRKLLFSSLTDKPKALIADSLGKRVCWTTRKSPVVTCITYQGQRQIAPGSNELTGVSVLSSSSGTLFYFTQNATIKAFDITSTFGVGKISIINISSLVSFLTVFDSEQKWTDPCSKIAYGECFGLCLALSETTNTCQSDYDKPFLLYLTESSEPHGISLDDRQKPDIFPSAIFRPDDGDNSAFLVNERTRYFWIEGEKQIRSVYRDGTYAKIVIETEFPMTGIAIDWIAGNLYWSVAERSMIWVSRLTGEYPYIVAHQDTMNPTSLAVHPTLGRLFWKECLQECTIRSSTLSGRRPISLVTPIQEMGEFGIDMKENHIYWTSIRGLERSDIYGKQRSRILSSTPISFAIGHDSLYWIDVTGSVMYKKIIGTKIETLKTISMPKKLLYVSNRAKKGNNSCFIKNGGCQHLCLYEGDGQHSCQCSYSTLSSDKKTCTSDASYILLANRNRIDSVGGEEESNNPNPPKQSIFPHPSIRNIIALCYHRDVIYFSDLHHSPFLFSVRVDGTRFRPILKEEKNVARQIEGITFDAEHRLLLWTDAVTPSIGQYSLETRHERTLFRLKSSDRPRGIAVASSYRKLFWTNWNDGSPKIETAFLNGSNHRTLLLSTLGRPNGITVEGDNLYWTDSSADVDSYWICRCKLDGSDSRILHAGGGGHPFDIVAFGKFLFWSDWGIGAVWKANKYGPPRVQLVRKNLTRPLGLTVVQIIRRELKGNETSVDAERCENGCTSDDRETPKSCEGSECSDLVTIEVQESLGISNRTKICISVIIILVVTLFGVIFLINRLYKRRQRAKWLWKKKGMRQIYKPRLNSIDSDRLTVDSVVVERISESHRRDDRISLIADDT